MMKRTFVATAVCILLASVAFIAPRSLAEPEHGATGTSAEGVAREVSRAGENTPAGHGGAAAEHGTAAEHGEAPLLPATGEQAKEYFLAPAIWTIVIFTIMLAILYPTAWKNVLAGLKKREQRIRQDIADAEASRAKAEATLREYNNQLAAAEGRVREMLTKAQTDGEKLATNIRMQAQKEAKEAKDRATRDIKASKNAALVEIRRETAELATSIASKILRRNLNPDDQRDLVRESLVQLQTIK